MRIRFRLGPFTFGTTGIRFSFWKWGQGVSVPLTGKTKTFGKLKAGPFFGYFGAPGKGKKK
jgi:hypothetical protein